MSSDDFFLKRALNVEYGEYDLFLISENSKYNKQKKDMEKETIHERTAVRIRVPEEFIRDMAPYLSSFLGIKLSIVWDSAVKYGMNKIHENISNTGLEKNMKIYEMLRRYGLPFIVDDLKLSMPTGVIYESVAIKVSDNVMRNVIELSKSSGIDDKTLYLASITISFLDSYILQNYFYTLQTVSDYLTLEKVCSTLKFKNIQLLDLFSVTGYKMFLIYNNIIDKNSGVGGVRIERLRWALVQLRVRKCLDGTVPENPLKHEFYNYKKEFNDAISECINKCDENITKKEKAVLVSRYHELKKLYKNDSCVLGLKIRKLIDSLGTKLENVKLEELNGSKKGE